MRVYIINENPDWIGPIGRSLDGVGVPWAEWFVDEGGFDVTGSPPEGVFFNRMSASSATRGHAHSIVHTRQLIAWCEAAGRRVVNGSRAFELEMSKVRQISALNAAGIRVPRTTAVIGGHEAILKGARALPMPLIVKPNCGGKGLGVRLATSLEQLEQYVRSEEFDRSPDGVTLLQEYIRSPEACITRCEFVGGEFAYAIRSNTSDGFELCPADSCAPCAVGGKFSLREGFDDPIIGAYARFAKGAGLDVCGIEFIEGADGTKYTYDINGTTNYNALIESAAGPNSGAGARLAGLLRREWQSCTSRGRAPEAQTALT